MIGDKKCKIDVPSLYKCGTVGCANSAAISGDARSLVKMNLDNPITSWLDCSIRTSPNIVCGFMVNMTLSVSYKTMDGVSRQI